MGPEMSVTIMVRSACELGNISVISGFGARHSE
ncbi:hypothetical protein MJ8_47260 [Mesorhizobium sp. J8]|nr:hypothetical protein MJ8_47260 [Mesorhizobium sp. J8]